MYSEKLKSILLKVSLSILAISFIATVTLYSIEQNVNLGVVEEPMLGASFPDAKWINTNSFSGYETKSDPTKVGNGANPMGQNTTSNNGDRISIRDVGYELFPDGTASSSESAITSLHTFRKRDGTNIMMRAYSTVLEYYHEDSDTWNTLKSGLSDGAEFGFADYNINTDLQSYVYFGNAVDDFARWSGANATLTTALSVDDSFVYVDEASDFLLSSGSIIVCGTELAYTAFDQDTFTFSLTASSTIACDNGSGVAETIETYATNPKGNIYLVDNNRLFIAGIASSSQAAYFSEYGIATNYADAELITDSTATAPGIFNLGEGGGSIIAMSKDEGSIYFFKESTIRKATLNDTLYSLEDLKPFDGKSQTIGANNNKGVFTGGNQTYFATPDKQIMSLGRVESYDYPQTISISDKINPTTRELEYNDSAGIVFRDKAYFSVKSTYTANNNDVILVWDIKNNMWQSPILGWNASDFCVYNDGTGEDLYFADANSPNTYKVIERADDNGFSVVANWRSKQYDFDMPYAQKQIVDMYIDGYISQNTTLTVSLLLDEDGYTQTFSHDITGTDDNIIYDTTTFNTIGLSPFGSKRFGSQEDISGKSPFRVYLGSSFKPNPFYNLQVDFASDGDSQDWEILNYSFKVRPYSVPERRNLYQDFK